MKEIAMSLNNIGMNLCNRGEFDRALDHFERSFAIIEKIGDLMGVGYIYNRDL